MSFVDFHRASKSEREILVFRSFFCRAAVKVRESILIGMDACERLQCVGELTWHNFPIECDLDDVCAGFVWCETGDESLATQCAHR